MVLRHWPFHQALGALCLQIAARRDNAQLRSAWHWASTVLIDKLGLHTMGQLPVNLREPHVAVESACDASTMAPWRNEHEADGYAMTDFASVRRLPAHL